MDKLGFFVCGLVFGLFVGGLFIVQATLNQSSDILSDERIFDIVSKRFALTHDYNALEYDCKNYSQDYATVMNLLGYETYVMYNYNTSHAYNLVAIEPQTYKIMTINNT